MNISCVRNSRIQLNFCETKIPVYRIKPAGIIDPRKWRGMRMKKVEAVVKPFKLEDMMPALTALGIQAMSVAKVEDMAAKSGTRKFIVAVNS